MSKLCYITADGAKNIPNMMNKGLVKREGLVVRVIQQHDLK